MRVWHTLAVGTLLAALLVVACSPQPAAPQVNYPDRPVNIIVGFAPGGPGDQIARGLQEHIKPFFPQPLTVVNKSGGGGAVGAAEVIQSKPDGYTIGVGYGGAMTIQVHIAEVPYKGPDDYVPVIDVVKTPIVLGFQAEAPWKTIKEAVDYAKANPGKLRIGVGGVGSIGHLVVEMFKDTAGINATVVPFDGAAGTITALLGGHIEVAALNPTGFIPQVQAGKVKVLVTLDEARAAVFPDVPTGREAGYDVTSQGSQWFIFAPKGTPDPIVKTLHDAIKKTMESDGFKKFTADNGLILDYKSGADMKKSLQTDYDFYAGFVKKINLKI